MFDRKGKAPARQSMYRVSSLDAACSHMMVAQVMVERRVDGVDLKSATAASRTPKKGTAHIVRHCYYPKCSHNKYRSLDTSMRTFGVFSFTLVRTIMPPPQFHRRSSAQSLHAFRIKSISFSQCFLVFIKLPFDENCQIAGPSTIMVWLIVHIDVFGKTEWLFRHIVH